jgi:endonuclease/exonuclease/phosphatase family metal-dependent hydrolase
LIFKYATENAVKIFSISEHHISAEKMKIGRHQKYNWEGSYRTQPWGGSGLLIHKSIEYKEISQQFDFQMEKTAIEFKFANESCCVFSIYLPQRSDFEIDQMEQLLAHLLENSNRWQNIILLGDFNAWNVAWGNRNNKRGIRLFDAIQKNQFKVEKLPKPTRIGNKNQKNTFVDLVITNRDNGVVDLKVGQKVSDHRLLSFTFTREPKNHNLIITKKEDQFSLKIAEMLLKHARLTIVDLPKQNTNVAGVALEQLQTCRITVDIFALQHIFLWNAIFAFSQIFLFFQMFSNNFKNV